MPKFSAVSAALGAAALAALPVAAAALQQQNDTEATGDTAMPWHEKTKDDQRFTFHAPFGNLPNARHLRANFNWYAASDDLAEDGGMFTSYRMHIGVTKEGRHEGIIYDNTTAGSLNAKVAISSLNKINGLTLTAEGGEDLLIELSDVKAATIPNDKKPDELDTVHYRTFQFPIKAYRMMGALPEENRIRFLYRKPDGKLGYFGYHSMSRSIVPWVYTIGYAKELSQEAIRQSAQ